MRYSDNLKPGLSGQHAWFVECSTATTIQLACTYMQAVKQMNIEYNNDGVRRSWQRGGEKGLSMMMWYDCDVASKLPFLRLDSTFGSWLSVFITHSKKQTSHACFNLTGNVFYKLSRVTMQTSICSVVGLNKFQQQNVVAIHLSMT